MLTSKTVFKNDQTKWNKINRLLICMQDTFARVRAQLSAQKR